jgi:hypothetical protein
MLVEGVLKDLEGMRGPSAFHPDHEDHPATHWSRRPEFEDVRALLDEEPERFADDYEAARRTEVSLPARGTGRLGVSQLAEVRVPTFISPEPPRSKLNKYWVRASGFPYYICPYPTEADRASPRLWGRVILSLDPTWTDEHGVAPSLRGLGFALERRECEVRAVHGDERPPSPRWDDGTCNNGDPWYDGRGHDFTIIDAPATCTHLEYDDVLAIACGGRFWHVPLASGTVTLMWTADLDEAGDAASILKGAWSPMKCPVGIDDRLAPFYEACRAPPSAEEKLKSPAVVARREARDFPPEARGGLELLHIEATEGATLEQLLAGMQEAVAKHGAPAYALSRIRLGPHNSDPARLDGLVRGLGDVDVDEMPVTHDELVLFNHRSLLVRAVGAGSGEEDGYLEVLFYLAFVREALRDYRMRLSDLLRSKKRSQQRTGQLRRDVLAFQTRYYDLEIGTGRARKVSERLVDAMHLPRSYGEIQDQMRQLAQLEARDDSKHRERADMFMESALFFVAVAGVFETIVAFLSWDGFQVEKDWWWVASLFAPFFFIWLLIFLMRRSRRT